MRLSLLLLTTPLLITACSAPPPIPVEEKPIPIVTKKNFSQVLESNFRGQYVFGDGKGYFKACDTNQKFSVDSSFVVDKIYQKIASTPYTPVYVEFAGEISFSSTEQKDNNVMMRIDRIHHMALAKASLQCAKPTDTFLFRASGDDPHWRINIDNEKLFFSTKASNQAYDVENSNFRSTQINYVYATNKKGQKLKLSIQPSHCYNPKNNEYWGYVTKVNSVWGAFDGCGEPGWPLKDQSIIGYYLSSNNNTTTNLALNENYTVEYSETINNITTVKTGYWKTNSPKHISVILSKEADKNIRQELILERQGLSLSTTTINNNNIVEVIEGDALVLNKMNAKEGDETVKVDHINREFSAQNIVPDNEVDIEIQEAVNNYFNIHRTDPKNTKFSAVKYDLNGDGVDEAIVLLDWCSNKNGCEMLIFEGQSDGYRFSSRVSRIHAPIIISTAQHYFWQSLLVQTGSEWSQLNFDGLSYPIHTRDLSAVSKQDYSTDVALFSDGKPTQWFPIKM
ncbi:membrane protein [Psychromonas marina]|uniref:Membrane protein n=1 Tax=Psychromonas marina TaxID=88364 RepID=A0ABQ6DWN9_9GAMM|nr:hypothetical protein [Psychromonas marina]GLS89568.1 membrane protein [Psychromonas marina]